MTSSFQGGEFRPIDQLDFVQTNINFANQQSNEVSKWVNQRAQRSTRATQIAGKELGQLAEFSKSFMGWAQAFEKKQEAKRNVEAQQWYLENGLPQDQADEYNNRKNKLQKDHLEISKIYNNDPELNKDEAWETKERFVNLAPWKQAKIIELDTAKRAATYNLNDNAELNRSLNKGEYQGKLNAYTAEFLEQFNGMNPALLEETVYKRIRSVQANHLQQWNAKRAAEIKQQEIDTIEDRFDANLINPITDVDGNTSVGFNEYVTDRVAMGASSRQASDEAINRIKYRISLNTADNQFVTDDSLEKLGDELVFDKSKGKTVPLKEHFALKDQFIELEKAKNAQDTKDYRAKKNERTVDFNEKKQSELDAFVDNPETLTAANVRKTKEEFAEDFPEFIGELSIFDSLLENFSTEGKKLNKAREDARELINAERFDSYAFSLLPPRLKLESEFKNAAREQTNVLPQKIKNEEAIENRVLNALGRDKNIRSLNSATDAADIAKKAYREAVKSEVFKGEPLVEAHKTAMETMNGWFQNWAKNTSLVLSADEINDGYDLQKVEDTLSGLIPSLKKKEGIRHTTSDMNLILSEYGDKALDTKVAWTGPDATVFFTRKELERITKEMSQPDWIPNAKVRYLQRHFGNDPNNPLRYHDVINKQRKVLGMTSIDETPATEVIKKLNPKDQGIVNTAQNPYQVDRAFGSYGENTNQYWIPEIVPDGAGEEITKASKELNQSPVDIAAAYELNILYPELTTGDRVFSPNEDSKYSLSQYGKEFFRLGYKYSGGDKFYLNELKRF